MNIFSRVWYDTSIFVCFVEENHPPEHLAEEQVEQIEPTTAANSSSGMNGLFLVSACSVIPVDFALWI